MKICLIVFRLIETQNKIDVETNSIPGQSSERLGVEILYKKHKGVDLFHAKILFYVCNGANGF